MSQSAHSGPRAGVSIGRERLAIAGSGTVAIGLAVCAVHNRGGHAVVWARSDESAQRAAAKVTSLCEGLDHPEAVDRVRLTTDLSDLSESTLVIEAVREDPQIKAEIYERLREFLAADTPIATTTSSLNVEALARVSGDPAQFFALHVFNPVVKMKLVELCFASETADVVRERAVAFCEAIGKTPIEVPDEPGFVVNRLLFPYLFDAVRLLERTSMAAADIDSSMKLGAAYKMGPLELLDLIGLDVAEAIGEAIHADSADPRHAAPGRIKELIGEGKLGRKSGAGFYQYG